MEDIKLLERVRSLLIAKYPNFAEELAKVSLKYNSNLPYHTAATDGKTIYFDPEYLESLSDDERVFILAHELMHIKFEHFKRRVDKNGEKRDSETWNIATDAIINANLERDGFKIKEGYVNIPEALKYNSEQMYQLLLQEKQDNQNESQGQGESQGSSRTDGQDGNQGQGSKRFKGNYGNGESSDHSMWEKAFENESGEENGQGSEGQNSNQTGQGSDDETGQNEQGGNQGQGESQGSQNQSGNQGTGQQSTGQAQNSQQDNSSTKNAGKGNGNSAGREVNHNQNDNEYEIDEKQAFEKMRQERRDFVRKTMEELKNQTLRDSQIGTEVGDLSTKTKPVVDWRLILRRALDKDEIVWSQRRSIAENNYAYRLEDYCDEDEAFTEVMIDTSGSISKSLLTNFLKQLKPLLKDTKLKVGCFDDEFYGFTEIKKDEDINKFRIRGGGGTDFEEAIKHFTFKPEVNKIVFTDGYDDMRMEDKKYASIIWIVFENRDFVPAVGTVIQVKQKDIIKNSLIKTNTDDEEFTM